jgi:hypothetical protein
MRTRTAAIALLVTAAVAPGRGAVARQDDPKAAQAIADARKAIGGRKLDALKTISLDALLQRNVGTFGMSADLEVALEMPDKYMRAETLQGPMGGGSTAGFNGDRPLKAAAAAGFGPGGGIMIRRGPGGPIPPTAEARTPEQERQIDQAVVRSSRQELSRLMLGWFATAHPSLDVRYTYAGEAESPDGIAHVVDVKNADGFAARLFIEKETSLPLMLTYRGPQARVVAAGGPRGRGGEPGPQPRTRPTSEEERKGPTDNAPGQADVVREQPPALVEYALYFDDWREVDGIRFPHRLRRAAAGATIEEWTVTRVRVNRVIDPGKFEAAS